MREFIWVVVLASVTWSACGTAGGGETAADNQGTADVALPDSVADVAAFDVVEESGVPDVPVGVDAQESAGGDEQVLTDASVLPDLATPDVLPDAVPEMVEADVPAEAITDDAPAETAPDLPTEAGGGDVPEPGGQDVPAEAEACLPHCDGKDCGDDGCGNDCGSCGETETCEFGECVSAWKCEPSYYNAGDGCDCECGAYDPDCDVPDLPVYGCDKGWVCDEKGHCAECQPDCDGKECGNDGCGGDCGPLGKCEVSNSSGTCEGQWSCAAGKLACDALLPEDESCDSLDNDCSGAVDDGPFADGFEANDDCSGAWAFEIKDTDIEPLVLQPTIFPSGDVDYFKVTVQEVSTDLCWPLDPECNWLEIQLVQPAAEGTHYAFAVLAGNCDAPAQTFAGQQSVVVEWAGKCFVSDGREFWVKVEPTQDTLPAYSCRPYSLTAQFSNKNGHCCTFKSCSTTPECTSAGCGACVSGFCSRP